MDFFAQFELLKSKTPRLSAVRLNNINSDYTYATDQLKNCYLLANAVKNEDCMYGRDFYDCADCSDCDHIKKCTLCYETLNSRECYDSAYLQDCTNCLNCEYGYDLKDCKNCIGCVGLRKKEFHIFNEPYPKEDFLRKKKSLSPAEIKKKFEELQYKVPRVYALQISVEHCLGDNIYHSRDAYFCFDIDGCERVGYIDESKKLHDCYDISILEESEGCYEISSSHILNNCNFCFQCASCSDLEYCELVFNSKNCFGCISLNHKEYYILNEPYSRQDYFKKVAEIKAELKGTGEYGRVFLSPTYPIENTVGNWKRV